MAVMSHADWIAGTKRGIFTPRSKQLDAIDKALLDYETKGKTQELLAKLKNALDAWIAYKGPGWKTSTRNKNGTVELLQTQINPLLAPSPAPAPVPPPPPTNMSLQANATMVAFAQAASNLWGNWANPPGGTEQERRDWRRQKIKDMIGAATSFMVSPKVVFANTGGSNGSFGWSGWTLSLRRDRTRDSGLSYADFVKYCRTMYHESRHAEQFYRIAQGLAAGTLKYPDISPQKTVDAITGAGGGGGVQSKVQLFQAMQSGKSPAVNAMVIAKWLSIPQDVANSAYGGKGQFTAYLNGGKPAWFRRGSVQLEVEEWMRATYKGTLSGLNRWTQSDDGPYKMYRDQPEEYDAHAIGNRIVAAIDASTGTASGVDDY